MKGGFALLDIEGGDDEIEDEPYENPSDSEKTTSVDRSKTSKPQPVQDQKKGKKGQEILL